MKVRPLLQSACLSMIIGCTATNAVACGEGMFSAGNGLMYQNYLAPRPATVLVYERPGQVSSRQDRQALFDGLQRAGHSLRVAESSEELAQALREQDFDVVIADLAAVAEIERVETYDARNLLPVVARSERKSPAVRDRFDAFLLEGSSLGQYLTSINGMMKLAGR